ncbi:MAG: hypothetical protein IJU26_08580, partial [Synergistaceae bacterium]|nr:hypothetical protein [Synergistaceae bacterium]
MKTRKFLCLFVMALAVFAFSGCGGSPSNNFAPRTTPDTQSEDVTPTPTPTSPDVTPTPTPTSPDVTPTPTSPDVTPTDSTAATPSESTLDVNDTAMASKVLSAVGGAGSDTQVAALPGDAVGTERSLEDVDPSELAEIPSNETPALALPIMSVNKAAVYVWGLDLSSFNIGDSIVMHMMPTALSAASVSGFFAAADAGDSYAFLDDNGNKITTVPASKKVNVAAYMEPAYTYAPIIAVKDTSSETPAESEDVTPVVPVVPTPSGDVEPFVPTSPDVTPDAPTSGDTQPDVPTPPTSGDTRPD